MIFKNEKLTKFKKPRKPYTRRKTKLDDKIAEEAQAIVTKLNRVNESLKHSLEKRSEKLSLTEKIFREINSLVTSFLKMMLLSFHQIFISVTISKKNREFVLLQKLV